MKITQVRISNFRGYKERGCKEKNTIDFNDLTVLIGKNDAGKSTVLEALDVFFNENKGVIKLEKADINTKGSSDGNRVICITVVFEDIPANLVIDSTNETNLKDEYLLNSNGQLEIIKKYDDATSRSKVFVLANHPTYSDCEGLLLKKQGDLKKIIDDKKIECANRTKNAEMRKAIWSHYSDKLQLRDIEIEVSKEDAKRIWEKLKDYMPLYSLFQSDRKNSDGDSEIQDPMKLAVREILKEEGVQSSLNTVAEEVGSKLKEVADKTLEKLQEMNPDIAKKLQPVIPPVGELKWTDVFKNVAISGDDGILINKRGSGVKRLILLNFFRAEAERRKTENNVPDIIYAIEEPETSQHPEHQNQLINALIELSESEHTQIILTTHSPAIVKMLDFKYMRLIENTDELRVTSIQEKTLPFPSLNEVNFLAFDDCSESYHNELYGFIEEKKRLSEFKIGRTTKPYNQEHRGGKEVTQKNIVVSEYIRHQIHHPENKRNPKYTADEMRSSIEEMRQFIQQEKG